MPRQITIPCTDLVQRYDHGESTVVLARAYHCSPTTIAKRLRACGAVVRRSRFQPLAVPEDELRRLYVAERWSLAEMAAHFGASVSTIGNKRRQYSIPARSRSQ
jgi:hypothetical protein